MSTEAHLDLERLLRFRMHHLILRRPGYNHEMMGRATSRNDQKQQTSAAEKWDDGLRNNFKEI